MNGENNLLKIAAILQSGIRDEADASFQSFQQNAGTAGGDGFARIFY